MSDLSQSPARPVIAIFGPTAVGKTDLAINLAQRLAAEGWSEKPALAVSLDSIAVYRELPILSGAPSSEQRNRLEHSLVGIRSVTESFSAGECGELAHEVIDAARSENRPVIAVGGTGLYMRAALSTLELRTPVDPQTRRRLQTELKDLGPEILHRRLEGLAPDSAERIAPQDGRRVTRALELIESGQRPPLPSTGLWQTPPRVPTLAIGLVREDDELKHRIRIRAEQMFDRGINAEVLAADSLGPSSTARAAVGWDEALACDLDGLITRTWQLARRQRTWFRKMTGFDTVDITNATGEESADRVMGVLRAQAMI